MQYISFGGLIFLNKAEEVWRVKHEDVSVPCVVVVLIFQSSLA